MLMKTIDDLNKIYKDAEHCDARLFAYQRSNVSLVMGNHYAKRDSAFFNRLRSSKSINEDTKIRLTKNHIQKICKTYRNNILQHVPGVTILPKNESELQDQKAAELHRAVWEDVKVRHNFKKRVSEWCQDFIDIGECICKVTWDNTKGTLLGFDESQDLMGNVVKRPIFSGDVVYDRITGFNLLRDPAAKNMDESRYLIDRKMVDVKDLKAMVGKDENKLKIIEEGKDNTYKIYNGISGDYETTEHGKTMLREFFYRPCIDYPNGYYYLCVDDGILFDGELPNGIFPFIYSGFDEITTAARSESIIKQLRPYQAEINRSASMIAQHQIQHGNDKVFIQKGSKIAHGDNTGGVQAFQYSGAAPIVQQGRTGEQFYAYMQMQIQEMYQVANVFEDAVEKNSNADPYAMLYRSMKDKKKFVLYAEKFERFLVEVCQKTLETYKVNCSPAAIVPAVGRSEAINVMEFKSAEDLRYQIKVEPRGDDIESMMGKQLSINHVLQYTASQLSKEDIGQMVRMMPFVNEKQMMSDLTIDFDNATNDILSLDRGQYVPANPNDNHQYLIKKLQHRMKQADFRFLNPQIQQMYQVKIQEHIKIDAEQIKAVQEAKAGFIPSGGGLVGIDIYDPSSTKRIKLPMEAAQWLIKRLAEQGSSQAALESMPQAVQAQYPLNNSQTENGQVNQPGQMGGGF